MAFCTYNIVIDTIVFKESDSSQKQFEVNLMRIVGQLRQQNMCLHEIILVKDEIKKLAHRFPSVF